MSKPQGANIDYAEERIDNLMEVYHHYVKSNPLIVTQNLFSFIANSPAKRFWISPARAAIVVSRISKGDTLSYMRQSKKEMFFEIYSRVMTLKAMRPKASILQLVHDVVLQPAPKFYLSPSSVKVMIYKYKSKWYKKHIRKSLHF